ncbi:MAG: hypothetical protein AB4426_09020 [Xenococcaceae cyanobacterium]
MNNRWYFRILAAILIMLLTACGSPTPSMGLAPDGELVKKAIALQLSQAEQSLSQHLIASRPELEISKINVKELEPLFIAKLPAYHLQGTYNLKIKLPRQQVTQKNNHFDIYLQRQAEGKTWRLIKREASSPGAQPKWSTYLIK